MYSKFQTPSVALLLLCLNLATNAQVANFKSVENYAGSSQGSVGGTRLNARFNEPIDMVFDDSGNLYIAEEGGSVIRIMDTDGNVSNFVGSSGSTGLIDGTGTAARFSQIRGIVLDNDGNLIVADKDNHAIRKVTPAGVVTTIAGGTIGFQDGNVAVAQFEKPTSVLVHSSGDIYVADALNNRIRKIDTKGNVSTIIGTGTAGYTDGDINTATISGPTGLAFNSSGDLIITTLLAVRRYDFNTSTISTITGGATATPFADGDKNTAGFNAINGIFIDEGDIMYIVDRHGIRHLTETGVVTTLAGNSTQGTSNGAPLSSRFFFPRGIVKDAGGDFLIADKASHKIRRILTDLGPKIAITTTQPNPTNATSFEVTFTLSESVSDFDDTDVLVNNGVLSDFSGNGTYYTANITPIAVGEITLDIMAGAITDNAGNTNEEATQFKIVSQIGLSVFKSVQTYAGLSSGSTNGNRLDARFNEPIDMVFDDSGNLYIAEEGGSVIRIMDTDGNVSNFVGSSGNTGLIDGTGTAARFNQIRGIALDNDGNLIVADKDNHAIRKVTPAGVVTTIAGGTVGFQDGSLAVAQFEKPTSVLVHSSGDIYVADALNNRIRKIDTKGNVSTIIGTGTAGYTDGDINIATISGPTGMAFNSSGDLIITTLLAVRRYDFNTSTISTIVGGATATPFTDGDKNIAGFNAINGLFIDEGDVMYIVDRHGIRHLTETGVVTTLAGNSTQGTSNGIPLSSRFFFPRGIVKDAGGDFLIADKASHKIRRIFTNLKPTVSVSTNEPSPSNATSFPITITLSESASDFTDDDVTVENGSISNFNGSGKNYTADIIPTSDGEVTIEVKEGVFTDAAGNNNTAASQLSITSDQTAPTVTITTTEASPTNTTTFAVTVTFSEDVTDFTADDITVGNGTLSNFEGSGASYTTDITPTADGALTLDIATGVATDAAGNGNTAATQLSIISDQTAPAVTTTTTEASPTKATTFTITITFSEDVTDFTADDITVGNGTLSNFEGSGANYTAEITPAADGALTVDIATGVATDAAGNGNTAATQLSIISDQTAPTVTITTTEASPTKATTFAITITFSEDVTDFTADDITVGNGTLSNFEGSGANYTAEITPAADGAVTTDIAADIATDTAGNGNTVAPQLSITSDQTAPTVTITTTETSPTNATSFAITITFSEDVTDFAADDITVGNGTLDNFADSGASYTADITPTADGAVTVDIATGVATDAAGNNNAAASQLSITSDQTAPTVTLSTESNEPVEGAFTASAIFSESVTGFTEEDIVLNSGTISDFNAVNGSTYTFKITSDQNTATLGIAESKASDVSGNGNEASESLLLTFNNSPEDILLDTNTIAENSGTDTSIGNFTTQDTDEADTHIYTLISGDGDTDNASFKIIGNSLIAVIDFDFETQDSYNIRVNSEDSFGSSIDKTFTITVTNLDEAILRVSGDQMVPNTGIGLSSTFEISIHNDGDGSLTVSSIIYPEGFTGPTSDITLAPAESENITVSFSPTERKTYNGDMVIASNGGSVNLTLTGIGELVTSTEEDLPSTEISVYPNPASTYIALDLSAYNGTPLTITLYDLNGTQRTSIQDYRKPSIRIDVSQYPNGVYLVGVSDGKFTITKKVMIRR